MVCERSDVFASSCAISRAFPTFSRRSVSSRRTEKKKVTVEFIVVGQESSTVEPAELQVPSTAAPTLPSVSPHERAKRIKWNTRIEDWFFFSVSCQCCRWCEARCPHRGHPLQRDEHGSLPGCTDTVYSFALANAVELFLVKVIKGFQPGPQDLKCLTVYLVCNTGVEVNNCNRFHYLLIFFLRDKPFNTNQKI